MDESSVTLLWTRPKNDGGKKIQGYVIEYKELSANRWKTFNDAPFKDTMATGEDVGLCEYLRGGGGFHLFSLKAATIFLKIRDLGWTCKEFSPLDPKT